MTVFSSLTSKQVATVFSSLALKLVTMVFSNLASKLVATVFFSLASKPVVSFLIESQNQGGGGFSSLGLKTESFGLVIWASKSPLQFLVWVSKPSEFQFVGCATKPTEGSGRGTCIEI
jgi:hypothetical protein